MIYIAVHKNNNDFDKNLNLVKSSGFDVKSVFNKAKMFSVDLKDNIELDRLKSFDFIEAVEESKEQKAI